MGDELELKSLYVVLPDGSIKELPAESASFEFAPEVPEPSPPCASAPFELTATLDIDRRALRMLLGLRVLGRRDCMRCNRQLRGMRFIDRWLGGHKRRNAVRGFLQKRASEGQGPSWG